MTTHRYCEPSSVQIKTLQKKVQRVQILRDCSSTRPLVWSSHIDGIQFVVKDYSFNKWAYCASVGRFLIYRERKALRRLWNIQGIPRFLFTLNNYAIVMEKVQGITLEEYHKRHSISPVFFDKFKKLISKIHEHGVAHCDLKRAANIIVGEGETPYIVDWSSAIFEEEFPFLLRFIYERFKLDDKLSVIKYKMRCLPELVSEEERELYMRRSLLEASIRRTRDKLRDLIKKWASK